MKPYHVTDHMDKAHRYPTLGAAKAARVRFEVHNRDDADPNLFATPRRDKNDKAGGWALEVSSERGNTGGYIVEEQ